MATTPDALEERMRRAAAMFGTTHSAAAVPSTSAAAVPSTSAAAVPSLDVTAKKEDMGKEDASEEDEEEEGEAEAEALVATTSKSAKAIGKDIFASMALFAKYEAGDMFYAQQRYAISEAVRDPRKSKLICYAMGTGKTFIGADIAVNHFSGKVVYMGPKSLHSVFRDHVALVGGNNSEEVDPRTINPHLADDRTAHAAHTTNSVGVVAATKTVGKVQRYGTITSEASNVYEQMLTQIEPVLGKINSLDKRSSHADARGEPISEDPLVLVIMDECHIFSARVAHILSMIHYSEDDARTLESQEKQAYKLYRLLCRDPRIRVIAMTGTPIKTHPFNFVPIANIVRKEFVSVDGRRSLAFPEVFGRFHDSYVKEFLAILNADIKRDYPPPLASTSSAPASSALASTAAPHPAQVQSGEERGKAEVEKTLQPAYESEITKPKTMSLRMFDARKLETFSTRLRGLVLWYEVPKGLPSIPFPVVESEEYVEIPMGSHQWKVYRKMEESEARIETMFRRNKATHVEGIPSLDDPSVYRSLTRQASNFAFPEDFYIGSSRSAEEMLAKMPDDAFSMPRIGEYSCKIERIMKSILANDDSIHGVFSSFVHGAGLAVIERCLKLLGWQSLNDAVRGARKTFDEVMTSQHMTAKSEGKKCEGKKCMYMVLTGDTPQELKSRIISVFNDPANTKTLLVRVVLYSGAAAHGLTFKSGRYIHFLEPEWDDVEEAQARDRFIRIGSAEYLPPEKRKVKIYYYLAVHIDPTSKEETTDQHLRQVAERKARLNGLFISWLKCAAINCEGMYHAENELHAAMISRGEVPPNRSFFRCVSCEAKYNQSYFLQELTDCQCTHTFTKPPGPKTRIVLSAGGAVGNRDVVLDKSTGLGWTVDLRSEPHAPGTEPGHAPEASPGHAPQEKYTQIIDAVQLRKFWKLALGKSAPSRAPKSKK